MMDCRPSDLVNIMSNPTTYYKLPVLLVKTTRKSRNHKNLNFDAKIGALQVGNNNNNNNKIFKCKLHHMVPAKKKSAFFKFRVLSVRPY